MSNIWCTNCGEWHHALEGTGFCEFDLDQGWIGFVLPTPLPDRAIILCPACTDKFESSGIPFKDYLLKPFKSV